jgi:ParB/RepB/Spo0J family partition protein
MKATRVTMVAVARIKPEEGLGRKRDRAGHGELCRSIERFGVLTPIAVRRAPDGSGDYLLIKGQGRTLACRQLGLSRIPAIVVDADTSETEKVQQFLVENVARLRMRPIDRALLIAHARERGEETAEVARRFGVTAATVRRFDAQLDGASSGEIAALRSGDVKLAVHAVIARHVKGDERAAVTEIVARHTIASKELETLFLALGWASLVELGDELAARRMALLDWACSLLAALPRGNVRERLRQLAEQLPMRLAESQADVAGAS